MKGSSRWSTIGLVIATISLVFCTSVVSGNVSLRYLPVSFNQVVGATTPFFTAVFAYLMTVKREAWLTYATLIPVVAGVVIASGNQLLEKEKQTNINLEHIDPSSTEEVTGFSNTPCLG